MSSAKPRIGIGERVRLREGAARTRTRPAGSLGTIYDFFEDDRNFVYVKWDKYYGWNDDDISVDQLEKA